MALSAGTHRALAAAVVADAMVDDTLRAPTTSPAEERSGTEMPRSPISYWFSSSTKPCAAARRIAARNSRALVTVCAV